MHKSNYDKASEVAMGKLRPKPDVSITISMKGGGGLSSLGDFPIIRRFMGSRGSYTDEMVGVEPEPDIPTEWSWGGSSDTTGTNYWAGGGADILGGQYYGKGPEKTEDPNRDFDDDPLTIDEVIRQRDMEIIKGQGKKPGEDYRDYLSTFSPRDSRLRGTGPNWSLDDAVRNLFNVHSTGKIKAAMDALEAERLDQRLKEEKPPEPERFEYTPKNYSPSSPMPMGRLGERGNRFSDELDDYFKEEEEKEQYDDRPPTLDEITRGIKTAARGGGLSSLNEMPVIRRFAGSYTDEDAGVDTGSQFDFSDYKDDGGADMLTGQDDVPVVYSEAAPPSTTPTDALQDYDYFGEEGRFPTWGIPPEHRRDKLALVDPDRPAPLAYADTDDNINYRLSQEVPLNFMEKGLRSIAQAFGAKTAFGLPAKGDTKLVSEEDYEKMYGNRAGFAAKLDNRANQWLTAINKVRSDIDKRSEEEDPKTPEEIEKEEREGLLEVAEKIFDKGSFRANEGQGVPGIGASYLMAAFNRAMGLLGTAEIDGIPVHVHEDGSVTPVSPEDEPGFDFSKMNITSDKEAKDLPTKKQYRPTTPKATTQDMIEEIYGTSPTRGEKRLASLESSGLQDRFRGVYGRPFRTI